MLTFSDDFFKDEFREDFRVGETMKRYWACCIDIVNVIDKICKKHNITYYADWGTLLGAVRHKGFIPWDDDIDLSLKRPDYERLMKILPQELPEGYVLSNCYINEAHKQFFAGVSNGNQIDISMERRNKFYGCPFVCTIDIFPMDYLPRDPEEESVVRSLFTIIWGVIDLIQKEADPEEIEKAVKNVETYSGIKIDRKKTIRSQMWKLANQLVMSYGEQDGDYLVHWCSYINKNCEKIYEKSWYSEMVLLPFENIMVPAPKEYDKILRKMYGDYQKRIKMGQDHDYPCFQKQIDFLKKKLEDMKREKGEL